MHRRAFLAASAAGTAAIVAETIGKAAAQSTETAYGQTADPLPLSSVSGLPLGPLPDSRYPDGHIESLDRRFKGSVGTGAVERVASGFR